MIRRRSMTEDDEMKAFKTIASGTLAGQTQIDIETSGLTEFYIAVKSARTDYEESQATQEYYKLAINDVETKIFAGVASHSWCYSFRLHCEMLAENRWICEKTNTLQGTNITSGTVVAQLAQPFFVETSECNKISLIWTGTSNVVSGTYEVIGR